MNEILKQGRPIGIFVFVVIVCAVIPGLVAAKAFFPGFVREGITNQMFAGLIAASPAIIPAFVITSLWGYIRYGAGGLTRFIKDFAFAGFTCPLSYLPATAVVSFFELSIFWFAAITIFLWMLALGFFLSIPRSE